MARFHHTVTVVAVDRAWFEACVGLGLDVVESTRSRGSDIVLPDGRRVPVLRLLKGRHLRAGARYDACVRPAAPGSADDVSHGKDGGSHGKDGGSPRKDGGSRGKLVLIVREWRRGVAIAVDQLFESDEVNGRLAVRLRAPDRPRALDVTMAVRSPDGSSLRRGSGRARVDLAGWWAAVGSRPGAPPAARPPVRAHAKHLLGRARLTLTPHATGDGSWQVGVTLNVRGRLLMRPVAALALFCCQVPLRRGFRSAVDQVAAQWNEALGETPLPSVDELRAEITKALAD